MGDNTGMPDEDLQLRNVFRKLVLNHYSTFPHIVLPASAFPLLFSCIKGQSLQCEKLRKSIIIQSYIKIAACIRTAP